MHLPRFTLKRQIGGIAIFALALAWILPIGQWGAIDRARSEIHRAHPDFELDGYTEVWATRGNANWLVTGRLDGGWYVHFHNPSIRRDFAVHLGPDHSVQMHYEK